jgi:hypothetical protein
VNVRDLLEEAAVGLPGIDVATAPDGSTGWSRGGRFFASVSADGSVGEFLLDQAIADAATRTPDVTASARGTGWVAFSPPELDDHAADRAEAWFASGHRRLGPRD